MCKGNKDVEILLIVHNNQYDLLPFLLFVNIISLENSIRICHFTLSFNIFLRKLMATGISVLRNIMLFQNPKESPRTQSNIDEKI